MGDVLTPEQRSRCMAAIKGKDTKPEKIVRSVLHRLGFRFRLHRRDLPGKPDVFLSKHQTAVLVHGCFWHMHDCKYGRVVPKTNAEFWKEKRESNVERDKRTAKALRESGIKSVVVWECETRDAVALAERLVQAVRKGNG
jgi:DNA mismatch endonuclease (patch repair protein)